MKKRGLWISLALVNLCIVALLGTTLRTKFLFPIPFVDYQNLLSAHSQLAIGGWVTLALMLLYIDTLLAEEQKNKRIYQWILWGIELTSFGMVVTFPFQSYALLSMIFSTLFIFFTYTFTAVFIRDLAGSNKQGPVKLLSIGALISLVLSSGGPFTLAYILATKSGTAMLYRDAIYFYLHFQYNGFFTLSVFALLFNRILVFENNPLRKKLRDFGAMLCISVIPTFFLTLLWHASNIYVRGLAVAGCVLIFLSLVALCRWVFDKDTYRGYTRGLGFVLLIFSMVSFAVKMLLQMGTIIPSLGNAVFGYRPIIIGFLHFVFLGFVSFYILSNFMTSGAFSVKTKFAYGAILFFASAVVMNEMILLVDGIGLMLGRTQPIYALLLWIAAILLFTGALLVLIARVKSIRMESNARIA